MTTIDKIGTVSIVKHGAVYIIIDRLNANIETATSYREARDAALQRADLVDGLAAITRH